jgi:signal transduction histidine kinase
MKNLFLLVTLLISFFSFSQIKEIREQNIEANWDQGVPYLIEDQYVTSLTDQLTFDSLLINNKHKDKKSVKLCRELGIAFYNRGIYDAADWYLSRVKDYVEYVEVEPEKKEIETKTTEQPTTNPNELESMKKDQELLSKLPKSYDNLSSSELEKMTKVIDGQIKQLTYERDTLIKTNASKEVIDAKEGTIKILKKERQVINLNLDKNKLKKEKNILGLEKEELKTYLIWVVIVGSILLLAFLVLLQRKTIKVKDFKIDEQLNDINTKNTYLEHAARIIRHDMHSGINTYIPRGLNSLEKRLTAEDIKNLKIESSIKMIREGLDHTQKVYKSVYEFTNLVKQNVSLEKKELEIKKLLEIYFAKTSYFKQVKIEELPTLEVNPTLFCNAIENLVKNGLKYNKSENKEVLIFIEDNYIIVQDNGVGMTDEEFKKHIKSFSKEDKVEIGLGLNISIAILKEHGYDLECERNEIGTKIKIKIKK